MLLEAEQFEVCEMHFSTAPRDFMCTQGLNHGSFSVLTYFLLIGISILPKKELHLSP